LNVAIGLQGVKQINNFILFKNSYAWINISEALRDFKRLTDLQEFLSLLRRSLGSEERVKDGVFGAMMQVRIKR
jgi:hypothetical protein